MIYIGIDPGASGGIARINEVGKVVRLDKLPTTEKDLWGIVSWEFMIPCERFCVIEWITPAIYGVAKAGMAKLYGNYMALRMALTAADIPFETERASVWQRAVGISPRKKTESRTAWKNRIKAKAQQLYPREDITLAVCDAVLIARYCMLSQQGRLREVS